MSPNPKHIAVSGGAGYIGSHTCVELLKLGHKVTVIDNLANSSKVAVERVELITGKSVQFFKIDCALEQEKLTKVFQEQKFDGVIHFAGLKAVGESVRKPLEYYTNNLNSTINLVRAMEASGCRNMIASSSATVYGEPKQIPITEDCTSGLGITNPYGKTKMMLEHILQDYAFANESFRCVLLRYFNPVGAHKSGLIGEDPRGIPNNLLPYISQVAVGRREALQVFGDDYDTPDGTGVRDYLHVVDLAKGHVAALERVLLKESPPKPPLPRTWIYNLGRGTGTSVLEMLEAMKKASNVAIPHRIVGRRAGDVATMYCDPSLAEKELEWKCEYDLDQICVDTWKWQSSNPLGFNGECKLLSTTKSE